MPAELSGVEQAVARTLRDNLEKIQRTADELHQAINDLVAACGSSRASNALPSMLRAQTSAASLSATLEVLSRFVTGALQTAPRSAFEMEAPPMRVPSMATPPAAHSEIAAHPEPMAAAPPAPARPAPPPAAPVPASFEQPAAPAAHPKPETFGAPPLPRPPAAPPPPRPAAPPAIPAPPPVAAVPPPAPPEPAPVLEPIMVEDPVPLTLHDSGPALDSTPAFDIEIPVEAPPAEKKAPAGAAPSFSLDSLPPEEQELHRRAFRVAKVSMQDIRMLRPEDVRLGRQNKDLCVRLRDDIEKAHKEYDRRFGAIQGHPVDYFYDWLVEILAGGDPQALGEYPYPSPVLRR